MTKIIIYILITGVSALFANDNNPEVDVKYISELRGELACFCGCGMTVQGCLGGMTCGESRELSNEVIQLVKDGKSREGVLQAMVAKYGETILSAPTKEGFNLAAWIIPFLAVIFGIGIVIRVVSGWRQKTPEDTNITAKQEQSNSDGYNKRFDEELKKSNS